MVRAKKNKAGDKQLLLDDGGGHCRVGCEHKVTPVRSSLIQVVNLLLTKSHMAFLSHFRSAKVNKWVTV